MEVQIQRCEECGELAQYPYCFACNKKKLARHFEKYEKEYMKNQKPKVDKFSKEVERVTEKKEGNQFLLIYKHKGRYKYLAQEMDSADVVCFCEAVKHAVLADHCKK